MACKSAVLVSQQCLTQLRMDRQDWKRHNVGVSSETIQLDLAIHLARLWIKSPAYKIYKAGMTWQPRLFANLQTPRLVHKPFFYFFYFFAFKMNVTILLLEKNSILKICVLIYNQVNYKILPLKVKKIFLKNIHLHLWEEVSFLAISHIGAHHASRG